MILAIAVIYYIYNKVVYHFRVFAANDIGAKRSIFVNYLGGDRVLSVFSHVCNYIAYSYYAAFKGTGNKFFYCFSPYGVTLLRPPVKIFKILYW